MNTVTTSLYAIAHVSSPLFEGVLTNNKEYPVFKILENKIGRRIVIINDKGKLEDWGACFFTFVQR